MLVPVFQATRRRLRGSKNPLSPLPRDPARILALAQGLPPAAKEIDAAGRVVTPGGVDAHCHLDQPMTPPVRMADDFDSGTRAAASV